ncbi:hypothetical protein OIU78_025934 [Salix suchowensis]|nr:hypothetical protein OIU78_025934 [Salix suchowensis]
MAKRKAKKKSPSSSSRPPPSCPARPITSGPSPPTKKQARHSSLPPQSRSLDLVLPSMKLADPNWLPKLCSVPFSPDLVASGSAPPELVAAGSATISQELFASGAAPSLVALGPIDVDQAPPIASLQPPSTQPQTSESSPSFSMLFAPVEMGSPGDSENDGSSAYNSDSSSHYGSPGLDNLELNAHLALGKDSSTSNDKSVEAVGNVSGGADLTALGSVATGSVVGCNL